MEFVEHTQEHKDDDNNDDDANLVHHWLSSSIAPGPAPLFLSLIAEFGSALS